MSVKLRAKKIKKGYSLFIDSYQNGSRHKEYLGLYVSKDYTQMNNPRVLKEDKDAWTLANSIYGERLKDSLLGKIGHVSKKARNADFLLYYKDLIESDPKKDNPSYRAALNYLEDFSGGNLPFKSVDRNYLVKFKKYLQSNLSNNTAAIYFRRVNIAWNKAVKEDKIDTNPFKRMDREDKPKIKESETVYLEPEELRKLTSIDPPIKQLYVDAFLFSCFTGLRYSDVARLEWSNIQNGQMVIRQKKSDSKPLYLPLNDNALKVLDRRPKNGKVFSGLQSNTSPINNALRKWARAADLSDHLQENIHFHAARHTYGTTLASNDVPIQTIKELMGHADIKQTMRYAKITDSKKREAVDRFPRIEF